MSQTLAQLIQGLSVNSSTPSGSLTIDSSGRLLVGTSTARSSFYNSGNSAQFQLEGNDNSKAALAIIQDYNANTQGAQLLLAKNNSTTVGSNVLVVTGDTLGCVSFQGNDGTDFVEGANITAVVDGTSAANNLPTRLTFSTTASGSASPTERMRITNNGLFKYASQGASYENATGGVNEFSGSVNDTLLVFRNTSSSITGGRGGLDVIYTAANPNSTSSSFVQCRATGAGVTYFDLRSNGGLANYSANNVNLSDRNVKKDIAPAAGTWDFLKEWEIVNFRYKGQPNDSDLNMGVIAQQVAESCPEVISVFQEAKEATETELAQEERIGVKEQQMMWMAIKALQEAQLRIETLEAEVAALKGA
jgi:hypothetical protein